MKWLKNLLLPLSKKKCKKQRLNLKKARQALAQVEAEKKQAIVKSKTAQIEAVLKDAKQVEIVAKAALQPNLMMSLTHLLKLSRVL